MKHIKNYESYGDKVFYISKTELEEICNKLHINSNNIKYLSSGAFGNAYKIDNKVLKITNDNFEYLSVIKMLNKNIPGVVNYYNAIRYKNFYCILMEYVIPLEEYINNNNNKYFYFDYIINAIYNNWNKMRKYNFNDFLELIKDIKQEEEITEKLKLDDTLTNFEYNIVKKSFELYTKLKQKPAPDFHLGNIGINSKGDFVLYDYKIVGLKEDKLRNKIKI